MNFLDHIFARLESAADQPVLQEVFVSDAGDGRLAAVTGAELLVLIQTARSFLRDAGLRKGDRCALLATNSIHWVALDLAIMAEGGIVVPLYSRQATGELAAMMKDCSPALLICGDAALRDDIAAHWLSAPRMILVNEIFGGPGIQPDMQHDKQYRSAFHAPLPLAATDAVTIIYTSGTSGEPKGVVLTAGNVTHMLRCTGGRLDLLMGARNEPERVFHYLPFCFCGSWILLLSCLSRSSVLTLSTDLNHLTAELRLAAPDYFLNVPILLERMRAKIEEQIEQRGGAALRLFRSAQRAWLARHRSGPAQGFSLSGRLSLWLAQIALFPLIRGKLGKNLKALICGSAALSRETQLFFMMLGIPVLQVYGLTETTAICTMDHPRQIIPGRVGPAIDGIEMMAGENGEILVRGPHIFSGYWNRPEATAQAMQGGWFHTGDQGEVDAAGNWAVTGRIKNLLVLASGHNVAPEPLEEQLQRAIPGAQHVVVMGNGQSYLTALITGGVQRMEVNQALAALNEAQPHYKRIRAYHLAPEPFTIDNGLLTANGKLKRDAIAARYKETVEVLYQKQDA